MSEENQTEASVENGLRARLFAPLFHALQAISTGLSAFGSSIRRGLSASMKWVLARTLQSFERIFLRSRVVRGSTTAAVGQSAHGAKSVDRDPSRVVAGASTNIKEILGIIDQGLAGGMSETAWSNVLEGLETVLQDCPNSKIPPDTPEHSFIPDELNLVLLAANSSRAAYSTPGPEEAPDSSRLLGSVEQITAAARDGSIKASILVGQTTPTSSILTVAFRGTVSLMDWLVNLDGDLEDATTFLCSSPATNAEPAGPALSITAHKGLLRVAIAMTPTVCEKILNSVAAITNSTTSQKPVLLITGHSAGGGVAALFTTHIRAQRREILELFEAVHCVTFAAPPVLSSLAVAEAPSLPSAMSLNIVNFGDIVPRASKEYVRSLLTLYSERAGQVVESEWDFGEPESWNYGKNVLLMDVSTGDEEDEEPRQEASSQDGLDMRAFDVRNEVWKRLAFGNVKSHPMDLYLEGVHHLYTRSRI